MMDPAQTIGIALGLGALGVILLIVFIKANVILCQPNELVILAGRQRKRADGSQVGYRIIRGGRGLKLPMVESAARLSLTAIPIEVHLSKAMCQGMIPVNIEGRASAKLAGKPEEGVDNAVERFLGKGPDAVAKATKRAIEGVLRGAVAKLSPEAANTDRLSLAQDATALAREELRGLGIVLDYLQIHEIYDDEGYLEAIGRKKNAIVQRDAKIAEAEADADARKVTAAQRQIGREAEIQADLKIVADENALSVKTADLAARSNQAEQRSRVAGDIARTEAQIDLETKRVVLAEHREQADVVVPAKSKQHASQLEAKGAAARIFEDGKATAEAIALMRQQWPDADTRELFMIRMLPELVDKVTRVIADNLRIDKLTILDGGDGEGLPRHVKNLTNSAVSVLEQMKNATGIDISKLGQGTGSSAAQLPKDLD